MALFNCRILGIAILTLQLTFSLGIPLFKDIHSGENSENGVLNLHKKNTIASVGQETDPTYVTGKPSTPSSPGITKDSLDKKEAIHSTYASNELGHTTSRIKNEEGVVATVPGQNGVSLLFGIKEENATSIDGKAFAASTESPYSKPADEYTSLSHKSKYTTEKDVRHIQQNSSLNTEETSKTEDIREKTQSLQEKIFNVKSMQEQEIDSGKVVERFKAYHSTEDTTTSSPRMVTTRNNDYLYKKMVNTENVTGNSLVSPTHENMASSEVNFGQRHTSSILKGPVGSGNEINQTTSSNLENGTAIPETTITTEGHKQIVSSEDTVTPVNAKNNLSLVIKSDEIGTSSNHEPSDVKENYTSQKKKMYLMNGTPIFLASTTTEVSKRPQNIISFIESAARMFSELVMSGKSKTSANVIDSVPIENVLKQEETLISEVGTVNSTIYLTSATDEDRQKIVPNKGSTTPTVKSIISSSVKSIQPRIISNLDTTQSSTKILHEEENETSKSVMSEKNSAREDHQKDQPNIGNPTPNLEKISTSQTASDVNIINSNVFETSTINEDSQNVDTNKESAAPTVKDSISSSMKSIQPETISNLKVAYTSGDLSLQKESGPSMAVVFEATSAREEHQKVQPIKDNTPSFGNISTSEIASESNVIDSTIFLTSTINEDNQNVLTNKESTAPTIKNIISTSMKSIQPARISIPKVDDTSSDLSVQEENETSMSVLPENTSVPNKVNTPSLGKISTSEMVSEVDTINTSAMKEHSQMIGTNNESTTPNIKNIIFFSMKFLPPGAISILKVTDNSSEVSHREENETSTSVVPVKTREGNQQIQPIIAPTLGKLFTSEVTLEDDTINSTMYVASAINEDRQTVVKSKENTSPTVENIISSSIKSILPGTIPNLKVADTNSEASHQEDETSKSVVSENTIVRKDHQNVQPNQGTNTTPRLSEISTSWIADHNVKEIIPKNGILSTRGAGEIYSRKIQDIPIFFISSSLDIEGPSASQSSELDNPLINETSSLKTADMPIPDNIRMYPDNTISNLDISNQMDLFLHDLLSSWNDNYTSETHEISSKESVTSIPEVSDVNESLTKDHGNVNEMTFKDVLENSMAVADVNDLQRLGQDSGNLSQASTENSASKLGNKLNRVPLSQDVSRVSELQELFRGLRFPSTGVILPGEGIL